jgi:hypothetical protein
MRKPKKKVYEISAHTGEDGVCMVDGPFNNAQHARQALRKIKRLADEQRIKHPYRINRLRQPIRIVSHRSRDWWKALNADWEEEFRMYPHLRAELREMAADAKAEGA